MNGGQDIGGMDGFGPIVSEPNEPVFHAEWERRAFALTVAMAMPGGWNVDMLRYAGENRSPREYLSMRSYEVWLAGLERLMTERGMVAEDEIKAGRSLFPPKPVKRVLSTDDVAKTLYRRGSTERATDTQAAFKAGERVRARVMHPRGHTRLPRYVRGHVGTIESVHGCHVFPDSSAMGQGENPQWLYTVRFEGSELWGADGDPTQTVLVDAWEPYLEPA